MKTKFVFFIAIIALAGLFASCMTEEPPVPLTVTFDSDGGSAVAPVTVNRGEAMGSKFPAPPARGGDAFGGWFEGVTRYTSDTVINVELQLKAIWIPPAGSGDAATVTFNVDGGIPSVIQAITVNKGRAIGPRFPQDPRKRGSGFTRWETADGTPFVASTVVNEDITVTAKWVEKSTWTVTLKVPAAYQAANVGVNDRTISVYDGDGLHEWPETKPQFPAALETGESTDPNRFSVFSRWSVGGTKEGLIYNERTPITGDVTLTGYFINNFIPRTFDVDLSMVGYFYSSSSNKNIGLPPYQGISSPGVSLGSGDPRTPSPKNVTYHTTDGTLTLGTKTINVPAGAVSATFDANPTHLYFYTPEGLLNVIGKTGTSTASVDNDSQLSFYIVADLYDKDGEPISTADTDYQFNFMLANLRGNDNWNATAVVGNCLDQINGKLDPEGKPVEGDHVPRPHAVVGTIVNFVPNRYWVMIRARAGVFATATPVTMVIQSLQVNLVQ